MKRSKHSLSHYRLTSMDQGELYPVACEEVLPGDSFRHSTSALIRVSPLVAPVMHPCHAMVHHWFVPSRLLWDNWEPFITGSDNTKVAPTITIAAADTAALALAQSFGVGVDASGLPAPVVLNALPFRAYNLIYNEFYRDQDLTTKLPERRGDTGDLVADYAIRKSSWEKDYYTTARPNPQQGSGTETVPITLSGTVPVKGLGSPTGDYTAGSVAVRESGSTTTTYTKFRQLWDPGAVNTTYMDMTGTTPNAYPNVRADMTGVTVPTGININDLRQSLAMQRMREHRNRFGSRYRDLLAYLGVNSSDSRLQRPEYLGGGKQTISFSEVLSTSDTVNGGTGSPVGEMAGHGIAALRTRPYKRFFEEHGYMLSFMCVRPVAVYMNRVPRHFLRRDYEQYWQKELEVMGDQAITNFEVYGQSATPSTVFGYIPRYDEYRHAESFVSGEFRTVLDYWHMARKFTSQPALNAAFVECDPTNRIYASTVSDQLYCMISHRLVARRLVSKNARN